MTTTPTGGFTQWLRHPLREIDRKITELRIVENWLSMTLNMMQMSIKTLELQKASLEAFSAAQQAMQPPSGATKSKPGK